MGVVLDFDFEFRLALHAKQGTIKLAIFLVKREFLQMIPNINILYTVENHFLLRLIMRDRYLKIRLYLARINCQSFVNLYENMCHQSDHFRREWRVPLQRRGREELIGTQLRREKWSKTAVPPPWRNGGHTHLYTTQCRHLGSGWAPPYLIHLIWTCWSGTCRWLSSHHGRSREGWASQGVRLSEP